MTGKDERPKWPESLPELTSWEEGPPEHWLTEKDLHSPETIDDLLWDMEENPDDRYFFFHDKSRPWPRVLQEAEEGGLLRFPKGENYYYRAPDNPNHFIQITPNREKNHPRLQQIAQTQGYKKVELALTERAKRSIKEIRDRHAVDRKAGGSVTNINIASVRDVGVLGDVGGQAVVAIDQSRPFTDEQLDDLRSLVDQVTQYQGELGMRGEQIAKVQETLDAIRRELSESNPDAGKIRSALGSLRTILGSLRTILEGAAGNVIASGILTQLGRFG